MNIDYETCLTNLEDFKNNTPETSIKYLFFYSTDLTKPKIKDRFRRWYNNYIISGVTTNNVCVYRKSKMKHLISAAVPIGEPHEYIDINPGDHIELGIRQMRDGSVVILSDRTEYLDITDDSDFVRSVQSCNFKLGNTNDIGTLADFTKNTCSVSMSGEVTRKINRMLVAEDIRTIYGLCKIIMEGYNDFSTCDSQSMPNQKSGGDGYKGVTFFCDAFISFLSERFFQPVYAVRGTDLISAQLVFDELNEVSPDDNRHFALIYDFERGTRNIFYIDFVLATVSCYATDQIKNNNEAMLTAYEKKCLSRFDEIYSSLLQD